MHGRVFDKIKLDMKLLLIFKTYYLCLNNATAFIIGLGEVQLNLKYRMAYKQKRLPYQDSLFIKYGEVPTPGFALYNQYSF